MLQTTARNASLTAVTAVNAPVRTAKRLFAGMQDMIVKIPLHLAVSASVTVLDAVAGNEHACCGRHYAPGYKIERRNSCCSSTCGPAYGRRWIFINGGTRALSYYQLLQLQVHLLPKPILATVTLALELQYYWLQHITHHGTCWQPYYRHLSAFPSRLRWLMYHLTVSEKPTRLAFLNCLPTRMYPVSTLNLQRTGASTHSERMCINATLADFPPHP